MSTIAQSAQSFGKILGIAVLKTYNLCAAQLDPGVNASVAVGIEENDIPGAGQRSAHAHGCRIAGGEYDCVVYAIELRYFRLQRLMLNERAVREPRPRGACSPACCGILSSFDAARVKRQAQVIIGAC